MNETFIPSIKYQNKKWFLIDAKNKTLGRLSSEISFLLQSKNLVNYYPGMNLSNYVVVINASKIFVSGKKIEQKLYKKHSGKPGSLKIETFRMLQKRIPERILEKSVKRMLPKGSLGRKMFTHLKIFKGEKHNHLSQKPQKIKF